MAHKDKHKDFKIKKHIAHDALAEWGLLDHMYKYDVEYIENYDGDTITFDLNFGLTLRQEWVVRLHRINTPEKRGKSKAEGELVQKIVEDKIIGKRCTIVTFLDKKGSFGRLLAEVFLEDGTNLNDWLLDNGYAKPYKK